MNNNIQDILDNSDLYPDPDKVREAALGCSSLFDELCSKITSQDSSSPLTMSKAYVMHVLERGPDKVPARTNVFIGVDVSNRLTDETVTVLFCKEGIHIHKEWVTLEIVDSVDEVLAVCVEALSC